MTTEAAVAVELLAPARRLSIDRDTRGMTKSASTAQFESQGMRITFKVRGSGACCFCGTLAARGHSDPHAPRFARMARAAGQA
jgi:hypothetical protein